MIGIALAAIYYFSVYNDGSGLQLGITTAEDQLKKNNAEVANIQKAIKDAEEYKQTMNVLGTEMEKVLKAVPAQLSSFDLMKIVSNEAKTLGVQINALHSKDSFRSGNENKDVIFDQVGVEVDLTGNYNQIMQFMSSLTKLDKIVTVKSLVFTSRLETSKKGAVTPTIGFRAELAGYKYIETSDDKAKTAAAAASAAAAAAAAKKDE